MVRAARDGADPLAIWRAAERLGLAFGPQRMMWGSDFPPVAGREGYARALSDCLNECSNCSAEDRTFIFGGVARSLCPVR